MCGTESVTSPRGALAFRGPSPQRAHEPEETRTEGAPAREEHVLRGARESKAPRGARVREDQDPNRRTGLRGAKP